MEFKLDDMNCEILKTRISDLNLDTAQNIIGDWLDVMRSLWTQICERVDFCCVDFGKDMPLLKYSIAKYSILDCISPIKLLRPNR